ncbi:MAG: pseudouridine synthase [Alloprevotella sp.]|nr:pseudouridine synthase [Alloprevotella sp.]
MTEELEQQGYEPQHDGNRDGDRPYRDNPIGTDRTPRPRINRTPRPANYSSADGEAPAAYHRPAYRQGSDFREGGYQSRPFRPAYGNDSGYRREGSYQRGGSSYRSGNSYRTSDGSYRPAPYGQGNSGYAQSGGYRPRRYDNGYGTADGTENAYRPRFIPRGGTEEGYTPRYSRNGNYRSEGRSSYSGGGYDRNRQQRTPGFKPRGRYNPMKQRLDYKDETIDPNAPIRLNKYLANAGICSRRDADRYIEAGVVTVNGEVVTELGRKVLRTDNVMFHDAPVKIEKKVYVLLNKPKGYVTTSEDPQNRKTVMDLVRNACPERIYPVGRLDRGTTGVLLLTNDGELATKLTHPQYLKRKIYHVFLDKNLSAEDMRQIAEGITLDDGDIKADDIQYANDEDKKQVGIEIHSGRNRIVRRIFESLGYNVLKLDRVYFAGLTKKNVRRGDWRYLTQEEVNMLRMGAYE